MKYLLRAVKPFLVMLLPVALVAPLAANGLNLNGIGSKAIAMGGAFIGLADDYSAVFWNPAGLVQLKKQQLNAFGTDLIPKGTYKYDAAGVDTKTQSKMYVSPAIGFFKPINDKLVAGILAYVPSGTGAKWDGEALKNLSMGRPFTWQSMIAVITVAPTAAYKVNERISVGAALNVNYGSLSLKRPALALNNHGIPIAAGQYEEKGNGWAIGGTVGVLVKPIEKLSVGLTFRTPSKVTFDGDATNSLFDVIPLAPRTSGIKRSATWPMWIGLGFCFRPKDKLTVTADAQYTNWKKLNELVPTFADANWEAAAKSSATLKFHWKDRIQFRLGGEYRLSSEFALRAGFYLDPSPSPLETLNILLPSISYKVVTFGVGYSRGKITIDACFEYLLGSKRTVTTVEAGSGMPGEHGLNILVPNIAITYRFR